MPEAKYPFLVMQPSERRWSKPTIVGTQRWLICDEQTPTASMLAGVVELPEQGSKVPMHYHSTNEELQYIVSGSGVVRDAEGNEYPLKPGTCVYCGPGPKCAHEFENTGDESLVILFVYSSPGGKAPDVNLINE